MKRSTALTLTTLLGGLAFTGSASAQTAAPPPPASPTGAPADGKALVAGPAAPGAAPTFGNPQDATTVTVSAGGLLTTGNSKLFAATANGAFENRTGQNGFAASILANYGQGAAANQAVQVTAENAQGKLRYDRYVSDRTSGFLLLTGRHDRFQGLDFRLNVDPGVKYLFFQQETTAFWGELGYDLQHDIRRNEARGVLDGNGAVLLDPAGQPIILDKTYTDHSARLFAGFRHSFNSEVTFQTGLEYLQSFRDSNRYRLNYDALFAAKVGGGLAVGFGFSARFDNSPLPGKQELDTSTNVSLIYAFSENAAKPAPTCPCPDPAAPPPPPGPVVNPPPAPLAPRPPPSAARASAPAATPPPPSATPAAPPTGN